MSPEINWDLAGWSGVRLGGVWDNLASTAAATATTATSAASPAAVASVVVAAAADENGYSIRYLMVAVSGSSQPDSGCSESSNSE
jgi:hypothetical protein